MAQTGVGIYKEGKILSIAAIQKGYRQYSLKGCRSFVIQSQEADELSLKNEITGFIETFLSELKLKPSSISFGLSRIDFLWNLIEMPPEPRSDLRQMLKFELDQYIPINPESVYFDLLPMPYSGQETTSVLLITTPHSKVNACLAILGNHGLKLSSIEPAVLSRLRLVKLMYGRGPFPEYLIVISFGEHSSELLILDKGFPLLIRTISNLDPWGRNLIREDAEDLNKQTDILAELILNELKISHISIGRSPNLDDLDEIITIGSVQDELIQKLETAYKHIRFRRMELPGLIAADQNLCEINAVSLAFFDDDDDEEMINLLPQEYRPIQKHIGSMVTGVTSGIFLSLMMIVAADNFWKTDLTLLQTNARIASLDEKVNRIMDINRDYDSVRKDFDYFLARSSYYPSELQILKELTTLLPAEDSDTQKKVWLESYENKDNQIIIKGQSDSPEGLINLLEDSLLFEKVRFEGTVTGRKFTIKASLSKIQQAEDILDDEEDKEKDQSSGVESTPLPTPNGSTPDSAKPEETKLPDIQSDPKDQKDENIQRGPAFPRKKQDPEVPEKEAINQESPPNQMGEAPDMEMPVENINEGIPQENLNNPSENSQIPELPLNEENTDPSKDILLDAIQQQDEQRLSENSEPIPPPPDHPPDDAAENFIEFLRTNTDERNEEAHREDH